LHCSNPGRWRVSLAGQVGTVVETLIADTVLVEFSGDDGRAYAIEPFPRAQLLVLHYVQEAAE